MERIGRAGIVTLDRPQALNALDTAMVRDAGAALAGFAADDTVERVLLISASPRAFCAGGDIRRVQQLAVAGDIAGAMAFFRTEYPVNLTISRYPKPFVSLIDGLCMGGGIGLSVHGRYRVVTERASLAMPETLIGFFPDVGGTHFLPRLPDHVGTCLGLTGMRIAAGDAVRVGMASHFVPSAAVAKLTDELCHTARPVAEALAAFAQEPPEGAVGRNRATIARCFGSSSISEIVRSLENEGGEWCLEALAALRRASPAALKITTELLAWGKGRPLAACLDHELRYAEAFIQSPDFVEGVRAALIEKDQSPRWNAGSAHIVAENLSRLRFVEPLLA